MEGDYPSTQKGVLYIPINLDQIHFQLSTPFALKFSKPHLLEFLETATFPFKSESSRYENDMVHI